jgi:SsrA-binding protein
MKVINRRAKFDYQLLDRFEAGVVLVGTEAKAARLGQVNLTQAHAKPIDNEIYLVNANIADSTRSRKLLLHKKEIVSIQTILKAKKLTLIPTKMYTKGRLIKVEIALAKSKRKSQKREALKKKDLEREIQRELKTP